MKTDYIKLAGEYCIKMEWNHDAIPELAKCLEEHDQWASSKVFELRDEVLAANMKLIHGNARLREAMQSAIRLIGMNEDDDSMDASKVLCDALKDGDSRTS